MWEYSEIGFAFSPDFSDFSKLQHGFGSTKLTPETLNRFAAEQGLRVVELDQRHSDSIYTLEAYPQNPLSGDGLVSSRKGLLMVIKTADCLPVLLFDPAQRVAAAAHCGWKGTSLRLLPKMLALMTSEWGCSLAAIRIALGPCIGPECYEVGQDLYEVFAGKNLPLSFFSPIAGRQGKYRFDLKASNRAQLLEAGIAAQNIFSLSYCTHCEKNLYSYRRDAEKAGRLLNFIGWCP